MLHAFDRDRWVINVNKPGRSIFAYIEQQEVLSGDRSSHNNNNP